MNTGKQSTMAEKYHPQHSINEGGVAATAGSTGAGGGGNGQYGHAPSQSSNAYPYQQRHQQQQHHHPSQHPLRPLPQRHWWEMTRTLAHYERIEQIGEGTYGQVYKARCKDTDQIVALKKIRLHHAGHWGVPPTVIREIKILKRLRHPNLVQMIEVVSSKGVEYLDQDDEPRRTSSSKKNMSSDDIVGGDDSGSATGGRDGSSSNKNKKKDRLVDAREGYKGNLFIVLEYVSHDLTGLMDVGYEFTPLQIKSIFQQLLQALQYMHANRYVHRDIKSSNILIDSNFRCKLADFGLSRSIEPPILDRFHDRDNSQEFTNKVITLWYRPPELLLGETRYGAAVDVWSAGCILAELILGKPLFTGKTDMDQLKLIFDLMGTPTPQSWPGFQDLKLLRTGEVSIDKPKKSRFREKYSQKIPPHALNLIERLLELDPVKRLTADRALQSRYFLSEPRAPTNPEDMGDHLDLPHFHEFQTKKKRREARAEASKIKQAAMDGGHTEQDAQIESDRVYKEFMAKVAKEGLTPPLPIPQPEPEPKPEEKDKPDERDRRREKDRKRDESYKSKSSDRDKSSRDEKDGDESLSRSKEHRRSSSKDHDRSRDRDRDRSSSRRDRDKDRDRGSKDRPERSKSKSRSERDESDRDSHGRHRDSRDKDKSSRSRNWSESDERRKKKRRESTDDRGRRGDDDANSFAAGERDTERNDHKRSSSADRHKNDRHRSKSDRRDRGEHRSREDKDGRKRDREDGDHNNLQDHRDHRRRRKEESDERRDRDRHPRSREEDTYPEHERRSLGYPDRGAEAPDFDPYRNHGPPPDDRGRPPNSRFDDHFGRRGGDNGGGGPPPPGPSGRYGPGPGPGMSHYGPAGVGGSGPPPEAFNRGGANRRLPPTGGPHGGRFNDGRHHDGGRFRDGRR